jgi:integrase
MPSLTADQDSPLQQYRLNYAPSKKAWVIKLRDPSTGKWRNKVVPNSVQDRGQAQAWSDDWVARYLQTGEEPATGPTPKRRSPLEVVTMASVIDRWVAYRKLLPKARDREVNASACALRRWVEEFFPRLWRCDLERGLDVPLCSAWVDEMRTKSGLAPYSVRNVVQCFRQLVTDCRGQGWVRRPDNPMLDPYVKARLRNWMQPLAGRGVIVALDEQHVRAVASYDGPLVPPARRALNLLALSTGMRAAEIAGLAWEHLDLQEGLVRVVRQWKPDGFRPPKKDSKRVIPLHPRAIEAMKAWNTVGWAKAFSRAPGGQDAVFPTPSGEYGHVTGARTFRDDLVAAGVPSSMATDEGQAVAFTFHAARRTFMTCLSNAGIDMERIRYLAGHSQQGVTSAHYIKRNLPRLREAINALPF